MFSVPLKGGSMTTPYTELAGLVAQVYAGKDWHSLSETERKIVKQLEATRCLSVNEPANGFVGKTIPIPQ